MRKLFDSLKGFFDRLDTKLNAALGKSAEYDRISNEDTVILDIDEILRRIA